MRRGYHCPGAQTIGKVLHDCVCSERPDGSGFELAPIIAAPRSWSKRGALLHLPGGEGGRSRTAVPGILPPAAPATPCALGLTRIHPWTLALRAPAKPASKSAILPICLTRWASHPALSPNNKKAPDGTFFPHWRRGRDDSGLWPSTPTGPPSLRDDVVSHRMRCSARTQLV